MNGATDTDAELFYRLNPEKFVRPERRTVRHILITFNTPAERLQAERQLMELSARLRAGADFAEIALRHSQCPTALEDGLVGSLPRGKLFPQLDEALYALQPGELSAIVETEVGLHLVRCDAILPPDTIPFEQVRERIIAALNKNRQINPGHTVN